jgi:hypothetical protein
MRKSLWIILTVLFAVIAAPAAYADLYTPTFTCTVGLGVCTSVPTAPDVSFPSPSIQETWDSVTYTISLPSSDAPSDSFVWTNNFVAFAQAELLFSMDILDVTNGNDSSFTTTLFETPPSPRDTADSGSLTFVSVATPEPGTAGLMLLGIGIGIAVVMQKRFTKGLQQVS